MKNPRLLIKISLIFGVIALLMAFGEYLALHDIWHDYVSKQVIDTYGVGVIVNLPDWSKTELEWKMVNISGLISFVYLTFSIVTLVICLKIISKKHYSD